MRSSSMMPRLVVGLTLCGLLLTASCIGGSEPGSGNGWFRAHGRFSACHGLWRRTAAAHYGAASGAGRVVVRPSGGITGTRAATVAGAQDIIRLPAPASAAVPL